MSEEERQFRYVYDRILIESSRVTSSSFPDIGVWLTGQELEVLRNLVSYATRRTTFVGEYYDSYYKVADDTDWAIIESVIANLEEKLMGNNNVIIGYNDRVFEVVNDLGVPSGTRTLQMTIVPAGYVYFIQAIAMRNDDSSVNQTKAAAMATDALIIERISPAGAGLWYPLLTPGLVLKEFDTIEGTFYDCSASDDLHLKVWGYKMQVP